VQGWPVPLDELTDQESERLAVLLRSRPCSASNCFPRRSRRRHGDREKRGVVLQARRGLDPSERMRRGVDPVTHDHLSAGRGGRSGPEGSHACRRGRRSPAARHREIRDMFCVLDETLTLRLGDWTIETGPGTFPVCLQALYRGSATTATAPFAGWASTPQPASRRTCAIWPGRRGPLRSLPTSSPASAARRTVYRTATGAARANSRMGRFRQLGASRARDCEDPAPGVRRLADSGCHLGSR
jgi:hypothetical protein